MSTLGKICLSGAFICATLTTITANAATITLDLTPSGSSASSAGMNGYGNSIAFSEAGLNAIASGYGATGTYSTLESAEVSQWATGLGVCNRNEGSIQHGTCSGLLGEHQIDGAGADDYFVLTFDQTVSMTSADINPHGYYDRDVRFWVGDVDLLTFSLEGLSQSDIATISGMGSSVDKNASSSTAPLTVSLDNLTGNVLIMKGQTFNDFFKFTSITVETTPIPVPAAAWLFGSALLGLAGLRRKASCNRF